MHCHLKAKQVFSSELTFKVNYQNHKFISIAKIYTFRFTLHLLFWRDEIKWNTNILRCNYQMGIIMEVQTVNELCDSFAYVKKFVIYNPHHEAVPKVWLWTYYII